MGTFYSSGKAKSDFCRARMPHLPNKDHEAGAEPRGRFGVTASLFDNIVKFVKNFG